MHNIGLIRPTFFVLKFGSVKIFIYICFINNMKKEKLITANQIKIGDSVSVKNSTAIAYTRYKTDVKTKRTQELSNGVLLSSPWDPLSYSKLNPGDIIECVDLKRSFSNGRNEPIIGLTFKCGDKYYTIEPRELREFQQTK